MSGGTSQPSQWPPVAWFTKATVGRFAGSDGASPLQSGLLGAGILVATAILSRLAIIDLVAKGYTLVA